MTAPRDVLDAHVSLFRHAQVRAPALLAGFREWGVQSNADVPRFLENELATPRIQAWVRDHPARGALFSNAAELMASGPEDIEQIARFDCGEVATALFDARTYQVTADMCNLAWQLTMRGLDARTEYILDERELPHPWGFLWLDEPLPAMPDSAGREVPSVRVLTWHTDHRSDPEVSPYGPSAQYWAFAEDPSNPDCPLTPVFTQQVEFGRPYIRDHDDERSIGRFLVMAWRLLDMEITSVDRRGSGDRQLDKQARRSIRHDQINVVSLRRPKHQSSGEHRKVEWSCAWVVRGHVRRYREPIKSGPNAGQTTVWIKPYIKGPDGAPLKASEVLYLLRN